MDPLLRTSAILEGINVRRIPDQADGTLAGSVPSHTIDKIKAEALLALNHENIGGEMGPDNDCR